MEHQYCAFFKNNKLQFGWVRELRKSKLVILPELGKEFTCAPNRVEYIWKGVEYQEEKEALGHLSKQTKWVAEKVSEIELETIHELCEPGGIYTLDELSENFLDEPENGWMRVALLMRLKLDNKLFQQKKNTFCARTEEEISEFEELEEKKKEVAERQIQEKEWAESLIRSEKPEIDSEKQQHWKQFIHRLKNFLLFLEKSQEKDYFCSLFNCHISNAETTERLLLNCLSYTEKSLSWGRMILERAAINSQFEDDEITVAKQLLNHDSWKGNFNCTTIDQRDLETYTVDSSETRDFDDALSWEDKDDGYIVRIHIADVASYVGKDSLLFDKAEERVSSLYTVKGVYPMFAPVLSEDIFSLCQGNDKPVLTFEVSIDQEGNVAQTSIYRSVINVNKNYSYDEIDHKIQGNSSFWPVLLEFCEKRKQFRKENGSLELDRVEVKLDISDPEEIKIKSIRENTPASIIIQELAILANYLAASFAKEHNLECLYRNQPPYSINKTLEEGEKPTLNDINIQPARINLQPDAHSALGLDCYMHTTSPIRRFLDLVNQRIILAKISDQENSCSSEELLVWAKCGEETQREYNKIERKLSDHWKIKYLEQNKDEAYDAELIRYFRNGKALIKITKLQLIIDAMVDNLEENEVFQIVIDSVLPDLNRVVVRRGDVLAANEQSSEVPEEQQMA